MDIKQQKDKKIKGIKDAYQNQSKIKCKIWIKILNMSCINVYITTIFSNNLIKYCLPLKFN